MNIALGKLFIPFATNSDILIMSKNSTQRISSNEYLELLLLDRTLNKCTR